MQELILNEEQLQGIADWMTIKKYSYSTWYNYMMYLKRIAKKDGKINQEIAFSWLGKSKNPAQVAVISLINNYCIDNSIDFFLKSVRIRQQQRKIPEFMTFEEVKKLVECVPMPYSLMLKCLFNIGAGIRVSDLVKMRYENFNWASWIDNKEEQGLLILRKRKRGKDSPQNVPSKLMKELYLFASSEGIIDEMGLPEQGLVFDFNAADFKPELREEDLERWTMEYIKHANNKLSYNIFRKYGVNFLSSIGNRKIHLHTMRHSRATYLYNEENKSIEELKELRDDVDISTTMIYTHIGKKKLFEKMKEVKSI
jgi:integrase